MYFILPGFSLRPVGIRIGLSYVPIAAKMHCRPPVTSAVMRSHERLNTSACRKNRGAFRRASFVRSSNSRRAASLTLNNSSRAVDLRASSPRRTTSSTMELSRLGCPLWGNKRTCALQKSMSAWAKSGHSSAFEFYAPLLLAVHNARTTERQKMTQWTSRRDRFRAILNGAECQPNWSRIECP
jgi:hypothetical protein